MWNTYLWLIAAVKFRYPLSYNVKLNIGVGSDLDVYRNCICIWTDQQWEDFYHEWYRKGPGNYSSGSKRYIWKNSNGNGTMTLPLGCHYIWCSTYWEVNLLTFPTLYSQMSDREFLIRVSYMEIYNEEINDLFAVENQKLQIHESLEVGFWNLLCNFNEFSYIYWITFFFPSCSVVYLFLASRRKL